VSNQDPAEYELVLTPPAPRALTGKLPESVATAVIEFLTTSLIRQPYQVGKPLRDDWLVYGPPDAALTGSSTGSATTSTR